MTRAAADPMSEALSDQAAGLRKLLRREALRSITVACAELTEGHGAVTANLAAALGRQGRQVLLVDCRGRPHGAAQILGVRSDAGLRAPAPAELRVTCVAAEDARGLSRALAGHAADADVLMVDAVPGDMACAAASREVILLVRPGAQGVTGGYRFLKRLEGQWGRRRILVLVDGASSRAQADRIFGNLSGACRRFLNLPVEYVGFIPDDERIRRAARLRQTVMEAFPESETARALGACAERLARSPFPADDGVADFAHRWVEAARAPQSQSSTRFERP